MSALTTFPKAYPYQEYSDDADVSAFFTSFNIIAQQYLDTFSALSLSDYRQGLISGPLLDWVAAGVYGVSRPAIKVVSGSLPLYGSIYNEFVYNGANYDADGGIPITSYAPVSDDIFRRIITWSFYKGDGFQFSTRWLKRRIERFIHGPNGFDPGVDQTYDVSILYSVGNNVTIRFPTGYATVTNGAICNLNPANTFACNDLSLTYTPVSEPVNGSDLQQAIASGVLPLPFDYQFTVQLS